MFAPSPGSRKETQTEQTEGRVAKPADASNNSFRRAVRSGVCDCGHSFKHVEWPLVARASGGLSRMARLNASALGDVGFEHAEREIARPGISRQLPLAAALPRTDPQIFAAL